MIAPCKPDFILTIKVCVSVQNASTAKHGKNNANNNAKKGVMMK